MLCDYEDPKRPGGYADKSVPRIVCTKCSNPKGCACILCVNCVQKGGHKRHEQYFVPFDEWYMDKPKPLWESRLK